MSNAITLTLEDDLVQRIADAVLAKLEQRPEKRWHSVRDAAEYTSLSEEALRTASKRGRLKGHRGASGRLVFTAADLDAFMSSPD